MASMAVQISKQRSPRNGIETPQEDDQPHKRLRKAGRKPVPAISSHKNILKPKKTPKQNATENSFIVEGNFRTGDFIILAADQDKPGAPIWRIEENSLLQKFEPKEEDSKTIYYNTMSHCDWNPARVHQYHSLVVNVVPQGRKQLAVECLGLRSSSKPVAPALIVNHREEDLVYIGAFEVFLQTLVSQVIDPNFFSEILKEQGTVTTNYTHGQKLKKLDELGHTGSGCLIKTTNSIEKMNRRNPDFCSVFRSELIAIYEALKSIRNTNYQDIWILTDSRSAIQHLSHTGELRDKVSRNIIGYLQKLSKTSKIHLQWIPSHVGIEGNEAADVLAKKGTKEPLPQKNKLTFKEIETVVKTKINKNWRIPPMHSWYSGVNPGGALNIRNRQHQTTLTRFRTGHLKPLKIENNNKIYPTCPKCSLAPAAPEHILACIRCTKQDLWERPLLIIKQLEEHELMEFVRSLQLVYPKACHNIIITDDLLREKAKKLGEQLDVPENFTYSICWPTPDMTQPTYTMQTKQDYFFQLIPDRTLAHKDENCRGVERMKQRITVLLCCNSTGIWLKGIPTEAKRYRDEILAAYVMPQALEMGENFLLMYDNARPHRAGVVNTFLQNHAIAWMNWPARSPDLNPIEHVWDNQRRRISSLQPPPRNTLELETALTQEWALIPQELINSLILSMGHQCRACLSVKGDHTPY
ncbi:MAP4K1 [Cordylochernes scorpioides]|uniref:MAP4K1 n=1 Tax=Cordylochernes scorpioides TaxID=51811 RepID=A0ABY6KE29_9ARAC|nr:MAP4K1 [Cordylochernes scorpioides]